MPALPSLHAYLYVYGIIGESSDGLSSITTRGNYPSVIYSGLLMTMPAHKQCNKQGNFNECVCVSLDVDVHVYKLYL